MFSSKTLYEDGSRIVRTVPGSIVLDMTTGRFLNPLATTRPNIRAQYTPPPLSQLK